MSNYVQEMTIPKLISPRETAKILGVSMSTLEVWRATNRYQLNFIKVGRKVMYRLQDIADFIESRLVNAG